MWGEPVINERRIRACNLCIRKDQILLVCLADPESQQEHFFPVGGAIEAGETPEEAALRELTEETGALSRLRDVPPLVSEYEFQWGFKTYHCTTHFFLSDFLRFEPEARVAESIIRGHRWFDFFEIPKVLGFDRNIRNAVIDLLQREGIRCSRN